MHIRQIAGRSIGAVIAVALPVILGATAKAEQIAVGNFGVAANGMPFAVALEKGYFKAEGIDVTGIISSAGGGTSLRNMLAGGVPYGEVNPGVVVAAIQQGADLKIISDNVLTVAEFVWAVKPDSPVRSIKDFKGRKIGYTNPRSTSQALDVLLLETAGLKPEDAELVKAGGFGEQVVALNLGALDIGTLADPVWSKNKADFRVVVRAVDALPPLCNVVGVATGTAIAEKGDFLRAVIRGRRKAVEFMQANPAESARIIAKAYNIDEAVALSAVTNLVSSSTGGVPYWGAGKFDIDGMNRMIRAQKLVGAFTGDVDWSKIIDARFLPDDLKPAK